MKRILSSFASNSLLHFFVIGGIFFALAPAPKDENNIVISKKELQAYHNAQQKRLGVGKLSPLQRKEVDKRVIWDELLYREAKRLGLGEHDYIVKQRLVQKMLFLAEHMLGANRKPEPKALKDYFMRHKAQWRRPARVRFFHIFCQKKAPARLQRLRQAAMRLDQQHPQKLPPLGDAFVLPREVGPRSLQEVRRFFGARFAAALQTLKPKTWSHGIASTYGWHLVKVIEFQEARQMSFREVQQEVLVQFQQHRKKVRRQAYIRQLYDHYTLSIEGYSPNAFRPAEDSKTP